MATRWLREKCEAKGSGKNWRRLSSITTTATIKKLTSMVAKNRSPALLSKCSSIQSKRKPARIKKKSIPSVTASWKWG